MIVCCGEALIDNIPTKTESGEPGFLPRPGGSSMNTAIAAARLDVPTAFICRISTDFFGDQILRHLTENGVDTQFIPRGNENTTLAFVQRTTDGERYAFFAENSCDRVLGDADLPETLPGSAWCIEFGSISLVLEPGARVLERFLLRHAQSHVLSCDPNVRPGLIPDKERYVGRLNKLMAASTIVKISDADLGWLRPDQTPIESARAVRELGPEVVFMTRGKEGSVALTGTMEIPVESVPPAGGVADTVGAGDSFHGALLAWFDDHGYTTRDKISKLSGDELVAAQHFAHRVAAVTCSRHGAEPPRRSEL